MRQLLEDPDVAGEGATGEEGDVTLEEPLHVDTGMGDTPD